MLGVLGGMGPMATVDFMAKVIKSTPASCDQDHIEMVVCSATGVPDRTAAILAHGRDPLPAMLDGLRRLESSGARCIAIPCNTAHCWHGALQAKTSVPILHIVDAVADTLARRGMTGTTIGVLATDGTVHAEVYQTQLAARGHTCLVPDAKAQVSIMQAIRLVKAGRVSEAGAILRREAEALVDRGCALVAMACTEIPLALADVDAELRTRLLDPTEALARACVEACLAASKMPTTEAA
ncbi:aspartate/glutamate racemase family protein [Bradyrhizobium manausense]|uniref:aspartate/glutamate racemase family protein n=1 Tax=Bradyrhizobium TaxID=374 RepID=UPI001BA9CF28|nr:MULTISPECIES: amino acid racemase [Bradyrhizobium]MBR0830777.1 aspartate/glutamate racemase family protein [Bradyrhizobium manausense]UVO28687.1 amino acid racemase [Bradyrhizobium arachidis]